MTIHFEFTGKESAQATVVIANEKMAVLEGHQGQAGLSVSADAETWIRIVNKETSIFWPIVTGRLKVRGNPLRLRQFERCVAT